MGDATSQILGRDIYAPAANDALGWAIRENQRNWDRTLMDNPLGKLLLADALLARYECVKDQGSIHVEQLRAELKAKVADLLRLADPALVLADFTARRLVLKLFNDAGLQRLELRVKQRVAA